ncbi:kow motif domain-containing protein [Cyclospora cayetanensis]|uniref:Kow motif domain-containing protein n=1 Tax=Cyclospora cayetanensis TaxID=88456 RepID=A0A1D3CS15_9EIME|nr:kow motif domain-containing protein [Cyclospora cayetanensis]
MAKKEEEEASGSSAEEKSSESNQSDASAFEGAQPLRSAKLMQEKELRKEEEALALSWMWKHSVSVLSCMADSLEEFRGVGDEEEEEEGDEFIDPEEAREATHEESAEASILPDMRDPKLWMVRLNKSGTEREEVIAILNKCFVHARKGMDLQIYSVFASDDLKGYLYVEAESQFAVKEALQGFRNLRLSGEIRMVPLKEMPGVFRQLKIQQQSLPQRGDFVRVKRGLYAGDLAQIVSADQQGVYATVRLIPRIDLQAMLERASKPGKDSALGRGGAQFKRSARPEKRFFDRERVDASGGCTFEEAGYIVRKIALRHLLFGSLAAPSLTEIREFSQPMSEADREESINGRRPLVQLLKQQRSAFLLGDRVIIIQGELQGLRGRISELPQNSDGGDNQIQVTLDDPKFGALRLRTSEVRKDFREGESVRALQGVNTGHSGLITHIDKTTLVATVFSPSTCSEFKCLLESLTHAAQSGCGEDGLVSIRGFSLLDFVDLTSGEKGVLVYIDPSGKTLRLLLPNNTICHSSTAQLNTKIHTELQTTTDAVKQIVERHALVKLACRGCSNPLCSCRGGPSGGVIPVESLREGGQVIHIWKDTLFVRVKAKTDNAGIIAVDAAAVTVSSGDSLFRAPRPLGGGRFPFRGPGGGPPGGFRGGGGPPRGPGGLRLGRRVDPLVGKQVKVQRGRHKGVIANVRSVERDELTVLLQTKSEVVKILKSDVQVLESGKDYERALGALSDSTASRMSLSGGLDGSMTPLCGDRDESALPSGALTPLSRAADLLPPLSQRSSQPQSPNPAVEALIDEDAVSLSDLSLSLGTNSAMSISKASSFGSASRFSGGETSSMSVSSMSARRSSIQLASTASPDANAAGGGGGRHELQPWCLKGVVVRVTKGPHHPKQGVLISVDAEGGRAVISSSGNFCAVSSNDIEPLSVTREGQEAVVVGASHPLYASWGIIRAFRGLEVLVEINGRERPVPLNALVQGQRL